MHVQCPTLMLVNPESEQIIIYGKWAFSADFWLGFTSVLTI